MALRISLIKCDDPAGRRDVVCTAYRGCTPAGLTFQFADGSLDSLDPTWGVTRVECHGWNLGLEDRCPVCLQQRDPRTGAIGAIQPVTNAKRGRIISFSYTSPALVNGFKTVTRRAWKDDYAARHKAGDFLLAYDRTPRAGGVPIARIRLTDTPVKESWEAAPDADWAGEGFAYLTALPDLYLDRLGERIPSIRRNQIDTEIARATWGDCKRDGGVEWVIRCEVVELLYPGAAQHLDPRSRDDIRLVGLEGCRIGVPRP